MNKHIKKYYKIVNYLVNKSYPTVKGKEIRIIEDESLLNSADIKDLKNYFRIRTNPRVRNAPNIVLIGLFAHELVHAEDFVRGKNTLWEGKTNWEKTKYIIKSFFMPEKNLTEYERETDINTIKKGYGKQRRAYWVWRGKFDDEWLKKARHRYPSIEEFNELIKKLTK